MSDTLDPNAVNGPRLVDIDPTLVDRITEEVAAELAMQMEELDETSDVLREALAANLVRQALDSLDRERRQQGLHPLSDSEEDRLQQLVGDRLHASGILEDLLRDPDVVDAFINRFDEPVIVKLGDGTKKTLPPIATSDEELVEAVRAAASRSGAVEERFDIAYPMASFTLPDGSRLSAVRELYGHTQIAIRKHRLRSATLDDLYRQYGTVSEFLQAFLIAAVFAPLNMLIVGGTGAGKTTLLRALCHVILARGERIVSVEDTKELFLRETAPPDVLVDVAQLLTRAPNVEGQGEVSMQMLVRQAQRMTADRIVVGEVRGAEINDMFKAMRTERGCLGTLHARSAHDAFAQMLSYGLAGSDRRSPEAVAIDIVSSVDLIVHLEDIGGRKVVTSVIEVTDFDGAKVEGVEILAPDEYGRAKRLNNPSELLQKRLARGGFDLRWLEAHDERWTWS